MSTVVGVVAMLVVVSVARPRPTPRGVPGRRWARWPRVTSIAPLGRLVRRRLPAGIEGSDRVLGCAVLGTVALAVVAPPLLAIPSLAVVVASSRRRRLLERARADAIGRGLPEVVDLLALGVGAGLTLRDTIAASMEWMPSPFAAAFAGALGRARAGEPFVDSLETMAEGLGDQVRPLVTVLVAAERDGAALVPALERASDEARRRRRVDAEEAARRVPVMLLFPLVLCVLPAFALLTVAPVLIGTLADLELPPSGP